MAKKKKTAVRKKKTTKKAVKKTAAKKKTVARKKKKAKKRSASSSEGCTDVPYCEYSCIAGVWSKMGEDFGGEPYYSCPNHPGGGCTVNDSMCSEPIYDPPEEESKTRKLRKNTGDYVLCGRELRLIRGKYDGKHFCPTPLSFRELKKIDEEAWEIVSQARKQKKVSTITINVQAVRLEKAN